MTRSHGILILLLAACLWSISGAAVKLLQQPAEVFALFRSCGALGIVLVLLPIARGRWPVPALTLLAAVLYTLNTCLLLLSMTQGTAAQAIVLQYTGPVWCALLSWLVMRRRLDTRSAIAIGVASIGVIVMLGGRPELASSLLGLGSGFSFGAMILTLDEVDRRRPGTDAIRIVLCCNVVCIALLLPIVMFTGSPWPNEVDREWMILVGIFQLGVPYVLFQLGLRRLGPVRASLISILEPVLNPIWVWLLVREAPGIPTLAGGLLILVAMCIEVARRSSGSPQ